MTDLLEIIRNRYGLVPLLYLSGPFTSASEIPGQTLETITKHASDVALKAWEARWSVISPHKNCYGYVPSHKMDYEKWMSGLVAQVVRCDAILLLPGWEKSKGCRIEMQVARDNHIPVFQYEIHGIPNPRLTSKVDQFNLGG
jgi:hypothetical protein